MRLETTWSNWSPWLLGILRIVAAVLFMEHGTSKLFGFPPFPMGEVQLFSLLGLAGILEFVGGTLLLIGFFTRPVAFILAGEMAIGYFMAHAPRDIFPANNGGDAAILFCFLFLYLSAAGPGAWSVDGTDRERVALTRM
jgi:putative oxidoreductase